MTLRLLAYVQRMMFRVSQLRAPSLWRRLERAEEYLLRRHERECEEWYVPAAELGGES